MKNTNPMIIQKDSSPYMYLTEYSGIYLNDYNPSGLNRGIKIRLNEYLGQNFYLVSFQAWIRFPEKTFTSTKKIFSIFDGQNTIDFTVTPLSNNKKAKISTTVDAQFYKNGNSCASFILNAQEWASIYVEFEVPTSFASAEGYMILHPGFVFNNISQFIYENAISNITTGYYSVWQNVLTPDFLNQLATNTWQDVLDGGTWQDWQYLETTRSDYTLTGDYVYGNQVGTSIIVNDDSTTINTYVNGADIFTDVEWQKIEKSLV